MSAFTVSDKHVSAILQGVYGQTHAGQNVWSGLADCNSFFYDTNAIKMHQQEANVLMAENIRSVNWRYRNSDHVPHDVLVGNVQLDYKAAPLGALQVLKLIDCLAYQSCETDDWDITEAFKLLNRYRQMLINRLPGYNDAKWSI